MSRNNLIGAGLAQHPVAAVGFQDEGRRLARRGFPGDLNRAAPVRSGQGILGADRKGGKQKPGSAG